MYRQRNAYPVYLTLRGMMSLGSALVFTVNMVYQTLTVGLSPLQLVLVGTTLELTVLLFEVPTGVVADVFSRRLSVIIGMFITAVGFALQGIFPIFEVILLSQVVWGIGWTFISGASDAWITDELGDTKPLSRVFLRGNQIGQITALLGIVVSVALATGIHIQVPIVLGGVVYLILGFLLIIIMSEHGFKPTPKAERETFKDMVATLREAGRLVKGRPILITIIIVTLFYGMYSEGYDRLYTKHILDFFTLPTLLGLDDPVIWFGVIRAVSMGLSIATTEFVQRRVNAEGPIEIVRVLLVINLILFAGLITFANAPYLSIVLMAYWTIGVMRSLYVPLWVAWINQNVESGVRATMNSAAGQIDAFGQIAGGPGVGMVGNATSTRVAITVSSMMLVPVLALYTRTIRRQSRSVEVASTSQA